MSTTVDSRVVEMRFDNQHFEKNVSTSMSTLDKLKAKLNLSGATKGLESVSAAANKVDFSKAEYSATRAGFQIQDVWLKVATVFEYQIAGRIINAATNMFNALMVAPVSEGWREYEMTLNAVQTTMAATGKTAEEVEIELQKLDEYADKTVYSTADMLNNLPKFTNAGVELETATTAMIGIANATALAGGDAGKASIAFYNLGQAIGTGYLTRMDYNSINNAGIATMKWKEQMVAAAIAQGTLTKVGEDAYKAGGKTLTLQQLFIDGLQEQWATTDVLLKVFGDYGDETTEIGKQAYAAAQDIKTYTQMMESLKATAGTGWKETWQIIFGGLDEAKVFWTGLTNFISGIITKMADMRNAILDSALGRGFTELRDRIYDAMRSADKALQPFMNSLKPLGKAIDKVNDTVSKITKTLEEHSAVVKSVIGGDWGNGQARWDALTEAGYDWAHVQNLVNEELGDSTRHTSAFTEQLKNQSTATGEATTGQVKMTAALAKQIATLARMDDRTLKALGYTEEQIAAFRELAATADKLGLSLEGFLLNIDEIDGRWLLIESFKNIGQALLDVFYLIKEAWNSIFAPGTTEEERLMGVADGLFNLIAAFHKFTTKLRMSDETAANFFSTMRGVFAIIDLVTTILSGGLKLAFKAITSLLKYFNLDILQVTAYIGEVIVMFRDWIDSILDFDAIFATIIPPIENAIKAVRDWIETLKNSDNIPRDIAKSIVKGIGAAFDFIKNAIKGLIKSIKDGTATGFEEIGNTLPGKILKGIVAGLVIAGQTIAELGKALIAKVKNVLVDKFSDVPTHMTSGFLIGLWDGIKNILTTVGNFAKMIIDKVCDILGIQSPSTVFIAIGGFIVAGLVAGLTNGFPAVFDFFKTMVSKVMNFLTGLDFGTLIAGVLSAGIIIGFLKIASALQNLGGMLDGVGRVVEEFAFGIKRVSKAVSNYLNSEALVNFAKAIAIVAAVIVVLALIGPEKLWPAVGVLAAITAVLAAMMIAASMLTRIEHSLKALLVVPAIGAALLLIAFAIKELASVPIENIGTVLAYLGTAIVGIAGLIGMVALLAKAGEITSDISKVGNMLIKMTIAVGLMVLITKLIALMSDDELGKGLQVIMWIELMFMGFTALARKGDPMAFKNVGKMMTSIIIALGLMLLVIKLASKLTADELMLGGAVVLALGVLYGAMLWIANKWGKYADKVGFLLISTASALLLLALVIKIAGTLDDKTLFRGLSAILGLGLMVYTFIWALSGIDKKKLVQVGGTLLAVAGAIAILAVAVAALSFVDPGRLALATVAVGALGGLMIGLLAVTKNSKIGKHTKGVLITMAVIIGLLGGLLVALSFIDQSRVETATYALMGVIGMFTLLMIATRTLKTGDKTAKRSIAILAVLAGVVTIVGGLVFLLAQCDPASVITSAASMAALMLVLVGIAAALGKIGGKQKTILKGSVALTALAGVMAILGGILIAMSVFGTDNVIANAIALAGLIFVLVVVANAVGSLGGNLNNILKGSVAVAALAAAMALIASAIVILQGMSLGTIIGSALTLMGLVIVLALVAKEIGKLGQYNKNVLTGALSIAALAAAMVLVGFALAIVSGMGVGSALGSAAVLLGVIVVLVTISNKVGEIGRNYTNILLGSLGLAALVGVMALIGLVLSMMSALNASNTIANAVALSVMILALTAVAKAMGGIGANATNILMGSLGLAALVGVMALLGLVLAMMSALGVTDALTNALILSGLLIVLTAVAAVLSVLGGMAAQIALGAAGLAALVAVMALIGLVLAMMTALGVKDAVQNAIVLSGVLVLLVGVAAVLSLLGALVGTIAMGALGLAALVGVMALIGLVLAMMTALGVKDAVTNAIVLASLLVVLTGVAAALAALGFFAASIALGALALTALVGIMALIGLVLAMMTGLGVKDAMEHALALSTLLITMAEVCAIIAVVGPLALAGMPAMYALLGLIGVFALLVAAIGALVEEFPQLEDFINTGIPLLEQLAHGLGSVIGNLVNGLMDGLTDGLPEIGSRLTEFMNNVSGFVEGAKQIDESVVQGVRNLTQAILSISGTGVLDKIASWVTGKSPVESFSSTIGTLGKGLGGFYSHVSNINPTVMNAATNSIINLAQLANNLPSDTGKLSSFGSTASKFGASVKSYFETMGKISSSSITTATTAINSIKTATSGLNPTLLSSAATAIKNLVSAVRSMASIGVGAGIGFVATITTIANTNVTAMLGAFKTAEPAAEQAGKSFIDHFIKGMESKQPAANAAAKNVVTNCSDAISGSSGTFRSAGKDLVLGFASGISENSYTAEAKARAMAKAAAKAAQKALDINSPSKVFRAIGYSVPEGFAMGIDKLSGMVSNSVVDMADGAIKGTNDSMSRILDAINADMDMQPTIRPVLDLSDVRSGAGAIGDLLGMRSSVGVMANIGSISSAMGQNRQNGNDDVVTAINKLRKDLGNVGNTTYEINGVTYDDGSNISEAVSTIARAIRIERRV